MAKLVKPVGGKKSLENVNEEAVVSSSSGFVSGEDEIVTSSKGKGRGRKAKKEVISEVKSLPAQKAVKPPAKTAGTGRGRKKQTNEEDKEQKTVAEAAAPLEKKSASKGRGKKADAVVVTADEPQALEIANVENGIAKLPAKRGRKAATEAKVEEAVIENGAAPETVVAPTTKGRGRGKKNTAVPAVLVEENEATLPVVEELSKQRGQKKSTKETPMKQENQNGGIVEDTIKETKKRAAKGSKAKPAQLEVSEESVAKVSVKNVRSRIKILKQEPEQDEIDEPLEKPIEKLSKTKAATKRKLTNEEAIPDDLVKRNEVEVKEEVELQEAKPSPNKKAKKQPKGKKTKEVKSNSKAVSTSEQLEKPKEPKSKSKASKPPEIETANKLENGVKETEKKIQGRKRAAAAVVAKENDDDVDGAKPAKTKKTSGKLINSTVTKYNQEDFKLQPGEDGVERFNLKISSWNVAGLRSWLNKDGLRYLEYELPDIFCLQEIKCTTEQMPEEVARIPGYHPYWLCMPGGYAGVAIYSKIMPINVEYGIGNKEFDAVGRMITAEYEKFFLINVYVPNSGRKLVNLEARMRWEKLFQEYVQRLDAIKPVVICGDMNVSHQAIDLANPKTNTRSAGFTQEERDKMTELLSLGFVDTFRHLYPDRTAAYTYWTYMANARSRNVGWRLDYFIVSERFTKRVVDNCIRSQVMGSDHCPITLFLKM